jgi:hypothetical protein
MKNSPWFQSFTKGIVKLKVGVMSFMIPRESFIAGIVKLKTGGENDSEPVVKL